MVMVMMMVTFLLLKVVRCGWFWVLLSSVVTFFFGSLISRAQSLVLSPIDQYVVLSPIDQYVVFSFFVSRWSVLRLSVCLSLYTPIYHRVRAPRAIGRPPSRPVKTACLADSHRRASPPQHTTRPPPTSCGAHCTFLPSHAVPPCITERPSSQSVVVPHLVKTAPPRNTSSPLMNPTRAKTFVNISTRCVGNTQPHFSIFVCL